MTPEGKVKKMTTQLLAKYSIVPAKDAGKPGEYQGYYFFAVQGVMSVGGIPDIVGHYRGVFFAIEVKAPGKNPTGFQALQISTIRKSGGAVFVVDGEESLEVFEEFLKGAK